MPRAAEATIAAPDGALTVTVTNINSDKGIIRLAICGPASGFPDCTGHAARTATLPITDGTAKASFAPIPAGSYAVSVFHDANSDHKLDTFLGIPREGYGFSGNPPFRPRAPRFSEAQIEIGNDTRATIKLRYLL